MLGQFIKATQHFFLEQQYSKNSAGYGGIRDIKYRPEKNKRLTGTDRGPTGPGGLDYREIEHIYHPSMKQRGVSSPWRE